MSLFVTIVAPPLSRSRGVEFGGLLACGLGLQTHVGFATEHCAVDTRH